MKELEKRINSNKNRNMRFVIVREAHKCSCCGKSISKGNKCLTLNKRGIGRQWQCMECVKSHVSNQHIQCSKYIEISKTFANLQKTNAEMELLPFDDEGGYLAFSEYADELKGSLYDLLLDCKECGKCKYSKLSK